MIKQFLDKNVGHYAVNSYQVSNEEPILFNMLLKGKRFVHTGGIASGGEVAFQSLIPRSRRVTVVDHAYQPLAAFYIKLALLKQYGALGFQEYVVKTPHKDFAAIVKDILDGAPDALKERIRSTDTILGSYDWAFLRREWMQTHRRNLERTIARAHNLTMIHGDLTDAAIDGDPFDLFYLSNALEHTNHTGKAPTLEQVEPMLKPKALVLLAGSATLADNIKNDKKPNWRLVETIQGVRTGWNHTLLQYRKAA
jgi:hypothetical protein